MLSKDELIEGWEKKLITAYEMGCYLTFNKLKPSQLNSKEIYYKNLVEAKLGKFKIKPDPSESEEKKLTKKEKREIDLLELRTRLNEIHSRKIKP